VVAISRLNDLLSVVTATTTKVLMVELEETIDAARVTTVLNLAAPHNKGGASTNLIEMVLATCVTIDIRYLEGTQHPQPQKRKEKDPNISLCC
jgi:hypothetical protein